MAHSVLHQLLGELLDAKGHGADQQQTAKAVARTVHGNQRADHGEGDGDCGEEPICDPKRQVLGLPWQEVNDNRGQGEGGGEHACSPRRPDGSPLLHGSVHGQRPKEPAVSIARLINPRLVVPRLHGHPSRCVSVSLAEHEA
jgi:hypothetical protein